jgi:hypothetical protein
VIFGGATDEAALRQRERCEDTQRRRRDEQLLREECQTVVDERSREERRVVLLEERQGKDGKQADERDPADRPPAQAGAACCSVIALPPQLR